MDEAPVASTSSTQLPAEYSNGHATSTVGAASEGQRIIRLSEDTINRIAAGEVVQRPSSALKELLENSIDAGSTNIKVQVKEGGLKVLSIQDNGSGIKKADLPLLCERFATSKLKTYDDLSSIATYGFRGEALASISHVAHVTVTTKTRDEACGYKARYRDGKLVPLSDASTTAEPRAAPSNDGTLILVEDLFYNTPTRKKSLRSSSDEYGRILEVVSRYAIHNAGIAMSCKKIGVASSDLVTSTTATTLDVLGQVYTDSIKKEMNELAFENAEFSFSCKGYVSGANYSGKKGTYIFFINNRLVDCTPLKRNLEAFYTTLLPKGGSPFVYISLQIHPSRVDVNVSPTKSEVHFLDQEDIIEVICEELQQKLASANQSRTFTIQTLLPGASPALTATNSRPSAYKISDAEPVRRPSSSKLPPQKLVRTDASAQTLDAMFAQTPAFAESQSNKAAQAGPSKRKLNEIIDVEAEGDARTADGAIVVEDEGDSSIDLEDDTRSKYRDGESQVAPAQSQRIKSTKIPTSACDLTSIQELRSALVTNRHDGLHSVFKHHTFVGTIDLYTGQSLIQHDTKLYLANHNDLCEELFYQLGLKQFGAFGKLHLKPPPSLRELLEIAVENEPSTAETGVAPETIVELVYNSLMEKHEMLEEYFSLSIDPQDGTVVSLPMVLPGWNPNLDKLPLFLLRLGVEVDWTGEKECFDSFLREMAFFNQPEPIDSPSDEEEIRQHQNQQHDQQIWQLKHVVFPALRYFEAPGSFIDSKSVVHVASLENLYKVFERC